MESGAVVTLPAPYFEDATCVLYHADCRDILPLLDDGSVDHVLMDPPYSDHVHENTRTNEGTKGKAGAVEIELGFDSLSPVLRAFVAQEVRRIVERWALVFSDVESTHLWTRDLCAPLNIPDEGTPEYEALPMHAQAGADQARHYFPLPFEYIRTGIWLKQGAMPQVTGDRPGSGYESIVVAHAMKGDGTPMKKRWNGGGKAGVWKHGVPRKNKGRVHPAEKPWPLIGQLLMDFTDPGDVILDPFAGSGSLARAAASLTGGRRVILIEADEQWCAQAASRRGAPVPEREGQTGLQW